MILKDVTNLSKELYRTAKENVNKNSFAGSTEGLKEKLEELNIHPNFVCCLDTQQDLEYIRYCDTYGFNIVPEANLQVLAEKYSSNLNSASSTYITANINPNEFLIIHALLTHSIINISDLKLTMHAGLVKLHKDRGILLKDVLFTPFIIKGYPKKVVVEPLILLTPKYAEKPSEYAAFLQLADLKNYLLIYSWEQ